MKANVYYCDRCGKLFNMDKDFTHDKEIWGIRTTSSVNGDAVKDLCPECEDDLERWFLNKQILRGGDDEDGTEDSEVS